MLPGKTGDSVGELFDTPPLGCLPADKRLNIGARRLRDALHFARKLVECVLNGWIVEIERNRNARERGVAERTLENERVEAAHQGIKAGVSHLENKKSGASDPGGSEAPQAETA